MIWVNCLVRRCRKCFFFFFLIESANSDPVSNIWTSTRLPDLGRDCFLVFFVLMRLCGIFRLRLCTFGSWETSGIRFTCGIMRTSETAWGNRLVVKCKLCFDSVSPGPCWKHSLWTSHMKPLIDWFDNWLIWRPTSVIFLWLCMCVRRVR